MELPYVCNPVDVNIEKIFFSGVVTIAATTYEQCGTYLTEQHAGAQAKGYAHGIEGFEEAHGGMISLLLD